MIIKGKLYDHMKFIAQVFLPAMGTLYFALAGIWGLPNAQEVMGTILAVDAFLGVLLGLSTLQYNNSDLKYDGQMNIVETPDKKIFTLDVGKHPDELESQDEVRLKVVKDP
jgi:hypothetical protein